jgi:hypothetical protein
MLWWACNLFAALVVVCVFLFGEGGERKVGFMGEGARAKTFRGRRLHVR